VGPVGRLRAWCEGLLRSYGASARRGVHGPRPRLLVVRWRVGARVRPRRARGTGGPGEDPASSAVSSQSRDACAHPCGRVPGAGDRAPRHPNGQIGFATAEPARSQSSASTNSAAPTQPASGTSSAALGDVKRWHRESTSSVLSGRCRFDACAAYGPGFQVGSCWNEFISPSPE